MLLISLFVLPIVIIYICFKVIQEILMHEKDVIEYNKHLNDNLPHVPGNRMI